MDRRHRVRIGRRAPDFTCDAVVQGVIEEVSLETYIDPTAETPKWLILLFIPAAFSFVCPTEVLAFQNCLDEFRERNCDVVFISVDSKHSLWHWQNVPRQYGGLGQLDISLLSDAKHRMSLDYGVLLEEEGVCLRGMFIIDGQGIVQQVTLNNLTVGRSVLEALRLLEAFQAVAKHGVLCPIDWHASGNTSDTMKTISNTLTESYDDRLANLQDEFGDHIVVTDLDAKHKGNSRQNSSATIMSMHSPSSSPTRSRSHTIAEESSPRDVRTVSFSDVIGTQADEPRISPLTSSRDSLPYGYSFTSCPDLSIHAPSIPGTPAGTPTRTPQKLEWPTASKTTRPPRGQSLPNYKSRRGAHIVLEFADPISSPLVSPNLSLNPSLASPPHNNIPPHHSRSLEKSPTLSVTSSPTLSRQASLVVPVISPIIESTNQPTRLQATFEAFKLLGSGLPSPLLDFGQRNASAPKAAVEGKEGTKSPGYFDVVAEGTA